MTSVAGVAPRPTSLEDVEWGSVRLKALYVVPKYVSREDREEAVNEGIRRVLDGTAPWDPAGGAKLSMHVAEVGLKAVRASARTQQRRTADVVENAVVDAMLPPPSSPEIIAARAEQGKRLFGRLVGEFAGDTEALAILACIGGSITEASDQAEHTGLDIEQVRNIRKRVHRRLDAIYEGAET